MGGVQLSPHPHLIQEVTCNIDHVSTAKHLNLHVQVPIYTGTLEIKMDLNFLYSLTSKYIQVIYMNTRNREIYIQMGFKMGASEIYTVHKHITLFIYFIQEQKVKRKTKE